MYGVLLLLLAVGFYALLLAVLAATAWVLVLLVRAAPMAARTGLYGLKLYAGVVFAVFLFAVAIVRGIFARAHSDVFGIACDPACHPRPFRLSGEIAEATGARPLDRITITADGNAGVIEEAGLLIPPGLGRQTLAIGMWLLCSLRTEELRAVLAHEYAHLSRRHSGWRRWVRRAPVSFGAAVEAMAKQRGYWLNPVLWVLGLYMVVYGLIAAALARESELHADRVALETCGAEAVAAALVGASIEGLFFEFALPSELDELARTRNIGANLYRTLALQRHAAQPEVRHQLRRMLSLALTDRSGVADAHPSLGERLRAQNIPTAHLAVPEPPRPIPWDERDVHLPGELREQLRNAAPSAAEEILGPKTALRMQAQLTDMVVHGARMWAAARREARELEE